MADEKKLQQTLGIIGIAVTIILSGLQIVLKAIDIYLESSHPQKIYFFWGLISVGVFLIWMGARISRKLEL